NSGKGGRAACTTAWRTRGTTSDGRRQGSPPRQTRRLRPRGPRVGAALPHGAPRHASRGAGTLGARHALLDLRVRLAHVEPEVLVRREARGDDPRLSPLVPPLVAREPRDTGQSGPRPHARMRRKLPRPGLSHHAGFGAGADEPHLE